MPMTVAIIGRPNVGKSTLFNRLAGRKLALVDDTPGVTRDRREAQVRIGELAFRLIDTAGLEDADENSLEGRMRAQTEAAIAEANVCLFMIDARAGVTPVDAHFAGLLRKGGKPVILMANKCEGTAAEAGALEAYSLGLGEPIAFSAEHGLGTSDLYQALQAQMENHSPDEDAPGEEAEHPLRVAVLGRPNAGKSTLLNRMIGQERLLTGPEAGITRDSISIDWQWQDRKITLWDTAGLRRKARVR
ncbi:MAG: ribosome biogenesis GTPase Der, partial [Hyphomicrobiales bacterium]